MIVKYKVSPAKQPGCDCEDCRAGRHIYSLYRWKDGAWQWAATSLLVYASAEECERMHSWGIQFEPNAVWEDGRPVSPPISPEQPGDQTGDLVELDKEAFMKSAERLLRHL